MSESDSYTPIDCGVYSEYELAIMHRRHLRLHWQDEEGNDITEGVMPRDLKTADKREYLIAERDDGSIVEIRLDKISKAAVADL